MPASVYVCVPVTSPVVGSEVAFDVGVPSPQSIVRGGSAVDRAEHLRELAPLDVLE